MKSGIFFFCLLIFILSSAFNNPQQLRVSVSSGFWVQANADNIILSYERTTVKGMYNFAELNVGYGRESFFIEPYINCGIIFSLYNTDDLTLFNGYFLGSGLKKSIHIGKALFIGIIGLSYVIQEYKLGYNYNSYQQIINNNNLAYQVGLSINYNLYESIDTFFEYKFSYMDSSIYEGNNINGWYYLKTSSITHLYALGISVDISDLID